MSKAIKWSVPFCTNDPIHPKYYRVDIYAEGYSGNPIVLKAGDTPFTTEEKDEDNVFAPVRAQSGTLQVCTQLPGGGFIDISDIMPSDNIARPVRLNRLNGLNGSVVNIEWQGFLSCEAYSQDYVSIPQNIDLSLISVLEAMDSVEVKLDESKAFMRVMGHVCNALKEIATQSGMSDLWGNVYISQYCISPLVNKYLYNNVYFSTEEQISGDNIVVDVHSISCKKILEQVAQFFGGCWREIGRDIYFEVIGKHNAFLWTDFETVYGETVEGEIPSIWDEENTTEGNISDLQWRSNDHQRNTKQGVRRVKVSSNLDEFKCDMTLQECPVGSLVENPSARQTTWGEVHVNTNETFFSLAEHKHRLASVKVELDSSAAYGKKATIDLGYAVSSINYGNTWPWSDDMYRSNYYGLFKDIEGEVQVGTVNHHVTSYMAWVRLKTEDASHDTVLTSGLMICALPSSYRIDDWQRYLWTVWPTITESEYIYKQTTGLVFAASRGKFTLDVEWSAFMTQEKMYNTWEKKAGLNEPRGLQMAIKWGNKWLQYDGSCSWVNSFTSFMMVEVEKDGKFEGKPHLDIPISSFNAGLVSVYIYPKVYGNTAGVDMRGDVHNLFITKLNLSYVAPDEELLTDRSENVYAKETGAAFKEELSVDLNIASNANNIKLATMLWESDGTTPVKMISLGGATVRPEVDLLNRLAAHYGAARQKLELGVTHPTAAPLPILRLNGVNDGKVYLPMAESRDWRMETSRLTCMEIPS